MSAAPTPARDPQASIAQAGDSSRADTRRKQMLREVEIRSLNGLYVHLPVWLVVAVSAGLHVEHPLLVLVPAALFLVMTIARIVLHRHFAQLVERRYRLAHRLLVTVLLGSEVQWGILAALSLVWPPLMPAHEILRLVTLAICAAGTMTLALTLSLRIGMPVALAGPYVVVLLMNFNLHNAYLTVLIVVFLAYITKVSGSVERDYGAAVDARLLLAERAVELERLSVTDALTQVHNRLFFDRRIAEEWLRAQRGAEPVTVLMTDLDHFKQINDTHGHPFGDLCLIQAATAMQRVLYRSADLVARYGGEEFVVLLPGTDAAAGLVVAERLLAAVSGLRLMSEVGEVRISCSIGAATMHPTGRSNWPSLLAQADMALYRAKALGRNRVVANDSAASAPALSLVTTAKL